MPSSRAVALVSGSNILLCGGLVRGGATSDVVWRIDPASGRIRAIGHLAAAVHDAGGAALSGSWLIIGGGRSGPGSVVQRVASTGVSAVVGRLPRQRADLAVVAFDGQLLVVGGGTPAHDDRAVLATRDGRRFTTIATLRVGVRYPAVAVFEGRVFVIGGSTPGGDTRDIQVVDPTTGVASIVGRLPNGLSHAAALVVGDQLLVAGGRRAGMAQTGVWRLDIGSDGRVTVVGVGHLPSPISDAAAVVVDGIGYLLGGEGRQVGLPVAGIVRVDVRR
jgi:hypothetical protein